MNMNIIALMMEAIRIREKPVCFGWTTQCCTLEGCNTHTHRHENLKSHMGWECLKCGLCETFGPIRHEGTQWWGNCKMSFTAYTLYQILLE
jgi:hypothetical protein